LSASAGMNEPTIRDASGQVAAFEAMLADVARRMGSVNVVSAAVACRATFGTELTPWEQRAVNRVLLPYRVRLEFPDLGSPAA
jgi:hypothetical protein